MPDEPRHGRSRLGASASPLVERYDCAMLDLDGVVYVGPRAVDGVPERLERARSHNMTLAFVTNNASRTPEQIATHLVELGVEASAADVVTSAQAAARVLAEKLEPGARVLVIGGQGLLSALAEHGLTPVSSVDDEPDAVVQGFDRSVGWEQLAQGAFAVRAGAWWVAANLDRTVPTAGGIAPGNGTLVDAIAAATGARPAVVAGKPGRPLFDETVRRVGTRQPLVVGDRLDTDIEGATTADADSLLVMTGVTDLDQLCHAPPVQRPTYVAWTLEGLFTAHEVPTTDADGVVELDGWSARVDAGRLDLTSAGAASQDDDQSVGLRVACTAAWQWLDIQATEQPRLRLGDLRGLRG